MTAAADIKKLSFEKALEELEQIVKKLESGDIPLEDAITHYERGARLKQHCEAKLSEARMKVDKITFDQQGNPDISENQDL